MCNICIAAYADDMYFIYDADYWECIAAMTFEKAMKSVLKSAMFLNTSRPEAS